jgi:hypothetical protein
MEECLQVIGLEYMIDCLTYVDVYLFSFMGVFDSIFFLNFLTQCLECKMFVLGLIA